MIYHHSDRLFDPMLKPRAMYNKISVQYPFPDEFPETSRRALLVPLPVKNRRNTGAAMCSGTSRYWLCISGTSLYWLST